MLLKPITDIENEPSEICVINIMSGRKATEQIIYRHSDDS